RRSCPSRVNAEVASSHAVPRGGRSDPSPRTLGSTSRTRVIPRAASRSESTRFIKLLGLGTGTYHVRSCSASATDRFRRSMYSSASGIGLASKSGFQVISNPSINLAHPEEAYNESLRGFSMPDFTTLQDAAALHEARWWEPEPGTFGKGDKVH